MSTNPDDYIAIDISISFENHAALAMFIDHLTGNDDDIVLAAETAMNKVLGVDYYGDGVQVHPPAPEDLRDILGRAIEEKERRKKAAMVRLDFDAKIREMEIQRDIALADLA